MIRLLRRWQLRDDIKILEHAIAAERERHENFEANIYRLQWSAKLKRAELAELADKPPKRAQFALSGFKRTKS